jgi:hypothetical protein
MPEPKTAMTSTLGPTDIEFLAKVQKAHHCLRDPASVHPRIQSLVDRGYVKLEPERIGPLASPTGETAIRVTEAGAVVLATLLP